MIIKADSRHIPLSDQSVNCIITSPPYWSLRKYDIPDLIWDGDEKCEHNFDLKSLEIPTGTGGNWQQANNGPGLAMGKDQTRFKGDCREANKVDTVKIQQGFCLKCSAWRGQLGLEPTIELYLKHLLQIMDECKRVLRDDGTMFINLGDSYYGGKGMSSQAWSTDHQDRETLQKSQHQICGMGEARPADLPQGNILPKSLCLIPERFAIEMVNQGWILRNKIIWKKPNCMPSSAKDRFTVDWEGIFFFVKSKKYWFEQQYEPFLTESNAERPRMGQGNQTIYNQKRRGLIKGNVQIGSEQRHSANINYGLKGRNRRCVWTISTAAYSEAHFATFPEALVEPMIRAGCPKFVCNKCGKAREKIVDVEYIKNRPSAGNDPRSRNEDKLAGGRGPGGYRGNNLLKQTKEIGLTDCGCNAGFRPGIVLDPFCGSGTVLRVAERLGRQVIGIDLGYEELADKRISWNQMELI